MGGKGSKQGDSSGQNINSVIVNESLQVHNEDIALQLNIIIVLLALMIIAKVQKCVYNQQHKQILKDRPKSRLEWTKSWRRFSREQWTHFATLVMRGWQWIRVGRDQKNAMRSHMAFQRRASLFSF